MAELTLLAYTDAGEFGGAERSLATLLAELDPTMRVAVLAVDSEVGRAVAAARPGTPFEVVPAVGDKRDLRAIWAHLAAVRRLRPRVLHANLWWSWTGQYGIAAGLATPGVRVVAVEHGAPSPAADPVQLRLKRLLSRRLSAHVSVGRSSARTLERHVGLAVGSVRTIYNGVVDVPLTPRPPADGAGPVVGSLGRIAPEKGFDFLVRALPALPDARVVLVGDGPERAALELLARELGVGDRLHVTGWTNEARSHLASFDVFVLPSRFEGFPISVIEAMLAERAVVASDVGSVSEAVIDGETGLLVPSGEPDRLAAAISELLADPERRAEMGRSGRALALEEYSASAMARAYERLYEEVLARPG